eukprot:scaffold5166_cov152-Cylindrotheca_fusiformis.AAC.4
MKIFSSLVLIATILSTSVVVVVEGAGASVGSMDSCPDQANCLQVTVNEIESKCGSPSCEFEVCWQQLTAATSSGDGMACTKYGDVQYVGDMHRFGHTERTADGGCVNVENSNGKGFWDDNCTDPENVYSSGYDYVSFFQGVCQVVSPGHTAHLLVYDGSSCSGSATIAEATGISTDGTGTGSSNSTLTATCLPSTSDPYSPTGQTFFPASSGPGGTCSGEPEGHECVWAITVPSTCTHMESSYECNTEPTVEEEVCPNLLEYYPNAQNGPPPIVPIHDISFTNATNNGTGAAATPATVSFRIRNPFGDDYHDLYTVYHEAAHGDTACHREEKATSCASDAVITAQCSNDDSDDESSLPFTFVTIFAGGYSSSSGAPIMAWEAADDDGCVGNPIFKCCPIPNEETFAAMPENVVAWTYLIHCNCPEEEEDDDGGEE